MSANISRSVYIGPSSLRGSGMPYGFSSKKDESAGWTWVHILNAISLGAVAARCFSPSGNVGAVSETQWNWVGPLLGSFLGLAARDIISSATTNATANAVNITTKEIIDQRTLKSMDSVRLTALFLGECSEFDKKESFEAIRQLMVKDPGNARLDLIRAGYIKCRDELPKEPLKEPLNFTRNAFGKHESKIDFLHNLPNVPVPVPVPLPD